MIQKVDLSFTPEKTKRLPINQVSTSQFEHDCRNCYRIVKKEKHTAQYINYFARTQNVIES